MNKTVPCPVCHRPAVLYETIYIGTIFYACPLHAEEVINELREAKSLGIPIGVDEPKRSSTILRFLIGIGLLLIATAVFVRLFAEDSPFTFKAACGMFVVLVLWFGGIWCTLSGSKKGSGT